MRANKGRIDELEGTLLMKLSYSKLESYNREREKGERLRIRKMIIGVMEITRTLKKDEDGGRNKMYRWGGAREVHGRKREGNSDTKRER